MKHVTTFEDFKLLENTNNRPEYMVWLITELESWLSTYEDDDGDWDYVNAVIERLKKGVETVKDCQDMVYYIESSIGQQGDENYEIVMEYLPNNELTSVEEFHKDMEELYDHL